MVTVSQNTYLQCILRRSNLTGYIHLWALLVGNSRAKACLEILSCFLTPLSLQLMPACPIALCAFSARAPAFLEFIYIPEVKGSILFKVASPITFTFPLSFSLGCPLTHSVWLFSSPLPKLHWKYCHFFLKCVSEAPSLEAYGVLKLAKIFLPRCWSYRYSPPCFANTDISSREVLFTVPQH